MLLIDEVDKADLEFPNDLLRELDEMRFTIIETGEEIAARERPVVIITSNNEKELPDAFLRRCIFHYIEFPDAPLMRQIIAVHHPHLDAKLLDQVLIKFYWLREQSELRKKPSTSELIDWISALLRSGMTPDQLEAHIPFIGALLKKEQDVDALARYETQGGKVSGEVGRPRAALQPVARQLRAPDRGSRALRRRRRGSPRPPHARVARAPDGRYSRRGAPGPIAAAIRTRRSGSSSVPRSAGSTPRTPAAPATHALVSRPRGRSSMSPRRKHRASASGWTGARSSSRLGMASWKSCRPSPRKSTRSQRYSVRPARTSA